MMDERLYRETFSRLHTTVDEEELILNRPKKRRPHIGAWILAATLTLLLGAGAFAAYQRSLRELVIRPEPETEDMPETASPRWDPLQEDMDFISLQGYADSPEKRAMEEWMRFLNGYDLDDAELAKVGNAPTGLDARYDAYFVYTQEMADALDAIAVKYGLTLHTGFTDSSTEELKDLYGDFLGTNRGWCYRYDDGTFQFDGENELEGYGHVDYQFRRAMKGVFDEVGLNVGDADAYENWNYTTASGETVLLALGTEKALIFADLPSSFVAVNVLAGTETDPADVFSSGPLSAADLEALADSFDFSILAG